MKKLSSLSIVAFLSILTIQSFPFAQSNSSHLENVRKAIKEQGAKWVAKETDISRMSDDEKRNLLGAIPPEPNTPDVPGRKNAQSFRGNEPIASNGPLPSSFSWGNNNGGNWMTPIKNQGQCGSCWAFASCGAFESSFKILLNKPNIICDVSEQTLVSCLSGRCDIGYSVNSALSYFESSGTPDESCFPYSSSGGGTPAACNPCSNRQARTFFVADWGYNYSPGVNAMKTAMFNNGPIAVICTVYTDFDVYGGGIYFRTFPSTYRGTHAIIFYGWNDADSCWLAKNSWGTDSWGETGPDGTLGWFKMRMGRNECGCEQWVYWVKAQLRAPLIPTLILPADNAMNVPIAPTLKWNRAMAAVSYRVEVSPYISFPSPPVDVTTNDTFTTVGTGLLSGNTKYYWRVNGINSTGSSDWAIDSFTTIPGTGPAAPVLVSPLTNAIDVSLLPTLKWKKVTTATSYTIQLADNKSFTSPTTFPNQPDTVKTLASNLTRAIKYYWRVKARTATDSSAWSTDSFTTIPNPPSAPVLAFPTDNAIDVSLTPTLRWFKASSATAYTVQCADNKSFTSPAVNATQADTINIITANLLRSTKYYWRVKARNSVDSSAWVLDSFTTIPNPPSAPVLASPGPNATNVALLPVLKWHKVNSATSYTVQLAPTTAFNLPPVDATQTDTAKAVTVSLSELSKYYWRVKAINGGGESAWSMDSFTTVPPAPPGAPILVFPTSNAVDIPLQPTLKWKKAANATSYQVQLALTATFDAPPLDATQGDTAKLVAGGLLTREVKYFWRVRAINQGIEGPWTVDSFTTICNPPGQPLLVFPGDKASDVPLTPTLLWKKISNATTYTIQIAIDGAFNIQILSETLSDTSKTAGSGQLSCAAKYFWRVRASNAGGDGLWAMDSFTTIPAAPGTPTLVSPTHQATNTSLTPTLVWTKLGAAQSYQVQLSADASFNTLIIDITLTDSLKPVESGLLSFSTKYFWRVQAINIGGPSGWVIDNFSTIPPPPGAMVLVSPSSNASDISLTPILTWKKTTGAEKYRVQVSVSASFNPSIIDSTLDDSSKIVGSGLLSASAKYFWRVEAINPGGSVFAADSFYTIPDAPDAPKLVFPEHKAIDIPIHPVLRWNRVGGAKYYRVQIASDSLFAAIIKQDSAIQDTSLSYGDLVNDAKHFWRVNASNAGGTGVWSIVNTFSTIVALPSGLKLKAPAASDTVARDSIMLAWAAASPKVDRYWLEYANDSAFSKATIDSSISDTASLVRHLKNPSTLWWRIKAHNAAGWSDYSDVGKFSVLIISTAVLPKNYSFAVNDLSASKSFIRYALPQATNVSFKLFGVQGKLVRTFVNERQSAGYYRMNVNLAGLSRGCYLMNFKAGNYWVKKKLTIF